MAAGGGFMECVSQLHQKQNQNNSFVSVVHQFDKYMFVHFLKPLSLCAFKYEYFFSLAFIFNKCQTVG